MKRVLRTTEFDGIPTVAIAEAERYLKEVLKQRAEEAKNDEEANRPHKCDGKEVLCVKHH